MISGRDRLSLGCDMNHSGAAQVYSMGNFREREATLREIEGVADEPKAHRRWFHDDYFDLFVWQTDGGDITLFQLCYGINSDERALVWHRVGGFFHDGARPANKAAAEELAARFEAAAEALPQDIRQAVSERVREHLKSERPPAVRRKRFRREEWQMAPAR
jgi:hypothetical protein